MNKTTSMVVKIIGAGLALAAVICLLIGGWHDLKLCFCGAKKRFVRTRAGESADFADEELLA